MPVAASRDVEYPTGKLTFETSYNAPIAALREHKIYAAERKLKGLKITVYQCLDSLEQANHLLLRFQKLCVSDIIQ